MLQPVKSLNKVGATPAMVLVPSISQKIPVTHLLLHFPLATGRVRTAGSNSTITHHHSTTHLEFRVMDPNFPSELPMIFHQTPVYRVPLTIPVAPMTRGTRISTSRTTNQSPMTFQGPESIKLNQFSQKARDHALSDRLSQRNRTLTMRHTMTHLPLTSIRAGESQFRSPPDLTYEEIFLQVLLLIHPVSKQ